MNSPQIVFIVDDDGAFLETTCDWLESVGFEVVACDSAAAFLSQFQPGQPGCLLLDIIMPKMGGLTLLEELTRRNWLLPTIAMTAHGKISDAVRAMKLGAIDYIEKPFTSKKALIELVRGAMETALFARQVRVAMEEFGHKLSRLTSREQEVLKLVVDGLSSSEIAEIYGNSIATVSSQRSAIMAKLSVDSIPDLIRLTLRYSVAMEFDPTLESIATFRWSDNFDRTANEKPSQVQLTNAKSQRRRLPTDTSRKNGNSR